LKDKVVGRTMKNCKNIAAKIDRQKFKNEKSHDL
jgi:hypothetical protein